MTNHLHLIVNCDEPFELKDAIRDFKRHTAKQILFQIQNEPESRREWLMKLFEEAGKKSAQNENLKFWKSGNHAIELYSDKFLWDKINYIHNNPVKESFVEKAEDWRYSSASNYFDGSGILEDVYCLPPRLQTVN